MGMNQDWHKQALALLQTGTMSKRGVARTLNVKRSTCLDFFKRYEDFVEEREVDRGYVDKHDNSRILVISDLHAPWNHPNAIRFLSDLHDKHNFTRIISVGDEVDKMAMSYHESNPDMPSAGDELKAAKGVIAELHELFPVVDVLESNHGSLHLRKSMTAGIPRAYIREYNDILGVGEGWQWHEDMTILLPNGQDCYFTHGKSSNGLKLSQNYSMNCVQGHHHSEFGIGYWSNPNNLYWSLQVGCLVDSKSLAMAYNKLQVRRPIVGCAGIIDSHPVLFPMEL